MRAPAPETIADLVYRAGRRSQQGEPRGLRRALQTIPAQRLDFPGSCPRLNAALKQRIRDSWELERTLFRRLRGAKCVAVGTHLPLAE